MMMPVQHLDSYVAVNDHGWFPSCAAVRNTRAHGGSVLRNLISFRLYMYLDE
jgi:hypothetical protein